MRIEVWADVACPWCWIGERRLERALGARPEVAAEVAWRPFQLQPGLPPEGKPWEELVRTKFGGPERAAAMFAHAARAGEAEGIDFRFDRIPSAPNTRDAHRLVLHAQAAGAGREMAETLFSAYFHEGRDVGRTGPLAEAAAAAGLDRDRTVRFLAGDELGAEVDASQADAARLGISGVPFFVFDGRYALSGAQPFDTFLAALDRAAGVGAAPD